MRWYGLSYLVGFVLGFLLIKRVANAGRSPLDATRAADFVVAVAIGIVVGGRLGYVLFYSRSCCGTSPAASRSGACSRSTKAAWPATAG